MGRRENNKFIPVVRDRVNGSYAFRGVAGKKETIKNVESLRQMGIKEKDIDILPVKGTKLNKVSRYLKIAGIICTVIDLSLFLIKRKKEKEKEKKGK
jgi:hypothetical protein